MADRNAPLPEYMRGRQRSHRNDVAISTGAGLASALAAVAAGEMPPAALGLGGLSAWNLRNAYRSADQYSDALRGEGMWENTGLPQAPGERAPPPPGMMRLGGPQPQQSDFDRAFAELDAALIDLDGDGVPDVRVPQQSVQQPSNAMAGYARAGQTQPANAMATSFPQMVANNPRGWGNAPPAPPPEHHSYSQPRNDLGQFAAPSKKKERSPNELIADFVGAKMRDEIEGVTNAMASMGSAAKRLFVDGGWQRGPEDPQAADDMRDILLATGAGATAVPRPANSLGAFGKLPFAEDLATPGKYATGRKPLDWGGAAKLSQARTAERSGISPDDIWEQHGWARQPEPDSALFNREAAERYGVGPGEWYMEYGSSPKQLGDRYALSIGQRRRTAPWRTADETPETAFDADVVVSRDIMDDGRNAMAVGPAQREAIAAERGAGAAADKLAKRLRQTEDAMRSEGLTDAQIANRIGREYGFELKPDDVATGRVWWRVTDREAPGQGRWQRPHWGDEAVSRLKDTDVRAMTNRQAAEALSREFGHPYHMDHIRHKRRALGILDQSPQGYSDAWQRGRPSGGAGKLPDAVEEGITRYFREGLSYQQVAEKVSAETGREINRKSVENWLRRRGIKREK